MLQIINSNKILVGDQNRDLQIRLFCVDINDVENEEKAIKLLKREFPRGSKVKIKPMGFEENILVARVFDISETKDMSELINSRELTKESINSLLLGSTDILICSDIDKDKIKEFGELLKQDLGVATEIK